MEYLINPADATEQDVSFQILSGQEFVSITEDGLLTFSQEVPITVKIYSNFHLIKIILYDVIQIAKNVYLHKKGELKCF